MFIHSLDDPVDFHIPIAFLVSLCHLVADIGGDFLSLLYIDLDL